MLSGAVMPLSTFTCVTLFGLLHLPSYDQRLSTQVREAALEMDKIAARKRMSLDVRSLSNRNPSGISDPGNGLMLRKRLMNYANQGRVSLETDATSDASLQSKDTTNTEIGSVRLSQDRGSGCVLASAAPDSRPQVDLSPSSCSLTKTVSMHCEALHGLPSCFAVRHPRL